MSKPVEFIRENDYPEFQAMMLLPTTYRAWRRQHLIVNGGESNAGRLRVCTLSPADFREYLAEHGKAASEVQLRHFATEIIERFGDVSEPLMAAA